MSSQAAPDNGGKNQTVAPLRIGMVAPPWYSVPPTGYGGAEMVVYLLARELQAMGHQVKVFAADSPDRGLDLIALAPDNWGVDLGRPEQRFRIATFMHRVYKRIQPCDFDILHEHNEATGAVLASHLQLECPVVCTVHTPVGEAQATFFKEVDREIHLVAISEAQKARAPDVRWAGVIHNAMDEDTLAISEDKDDYLLELGRITPDKGQHVAIEVARQVGRPLILAGKVDPSPEAQAYFAGKIEPNLGPGVSWIPNVTGTDKARLLARAQAMLFPLNWEEPFGIAVVEAMASGTPVIAFRRGATPELIEDGITGFVVDDFDEMVEACGRIGDIDPMLCAQRARDEFNARRMAARYEAVYRAALSSSPGLELTSAGPTGPS